MKTPERDMPSRDSQYVSIFAQMSSKLMMSRCHQILHPWVKRFSCWECWLTDGHTYRQTDKQDQFYTVDRWRGREKIWFFYRYQNFSSNLIKLFLNISARKIPKSKRNVVKNAIVENTPQVDPILIWCLTWTHGPYMSLDKIDNSLHTSFIW